MKINAIKCKNCGNVIYSRTTHDFRWCDCNKCAIDGGFEYIKITGNPGDWERADVFVLEDRNEIEAKKILYDDWNNRTDYFGKIKE